MPAGITVWTVWSSKVNSTAFQCSVLITAEQQRWTQTGRCEAAQSWPLWSVVLRWPLIKFSRTNSTHSDRQRHDLDLWSSDQFTSIK